MTLLDASLGRQPSRGPTHPDEVVRLEGDARRAIETGRTRMLVAGALFTVAFLVIAVRLVAVAVMQDGAEPRVAGCAGRRLPNRTRPHSSEHSS